METVSRRREQTRQELGMDTIDKNQSALTQEEEKRDKEREWRDSIEQSASYRLCKGLAVAMDQFLLDPLMGLIPVVGDLVSSIGTLPYIYVSLFKVHSIPLTLAIIYNALVDILIGLFPVLGDFLDIFIRSYRKNARMIVGYVENDPKVRRQVRGSTLKMCIFIAILGICIYYMYQLALWIGHIIAGWF